MFQKLIEAIKKVVNKLFSKESVSKALSVDVSVSDKMSKKIDRWTKMYEDKSPWLSDKTKSLNLSSGIASELARLVTLEMKSEIADSDKEGSRAEYLNRIYQKLLSQIRIQTEYACAKGGLVFKPFVIDDKIIIDCVQADRVLPIEFVDGELMSCVFMYKYVMNNSSFTRLEFHHWNGSKYIITNKAYENKFSNDELGAEVSLTRVERWANIEKEVVIDGISRPLFSYFKIPLANTVDSNSNLGVSVYSRAEDLIKEADEQYSRILWEFEGSELAIDADGTALIIQNGRHQLPARDERLFRRLDLQGKNGDFYNVFSPSIRDSSLFNGLNKILQRIEFACGLAYGTISDINETAKTATEILSSKQRSYATVSDIQKALKEALENLLVSMDELCTLYNLAPKGDIETSFEFDDSLIVDSGTDQSIMLQEVSAGIIRPEVYLMRRYGLTEEQCKEYMPKVDVVKEKEDVEEE